MVSSPEEYKWSSYRFYSEGEAPSWLSTGFVLGYFGTEQGERRRSYRTYVMEAVGKKCPDPLAGSIASTILGSDDFARDIRKKYLEGRGSDRDVPALRELKQRPDIKKIKEWSEKAFPGDGRQARAAGIYLCHRFSGVKLKDIGDLYGISESGVTQAGKRFEETMKKDSSLEKRVLEIAGKLGLSIV